MITPTKFISGDTDSVDEACQVITVGEDALCLEPESDAQSRNSVTAASSESSEKVCLISKKNL